MKDCIFCKIVAGEIPAAKLYEDKRFIAILDAFPAVEAQFLVIPKAHVTSKFTDVPDHVLAEAMLVAKKIAKHIDTILKTRSYVVIEGVDVPHLHIKVYPSQPGKPLVLGPTSKADSDKLATLAEKLRL
jgi:histidine triad (HIT) family protein